MAYAQIGDLGENVKFVPFKSTAENFFFNVLDLNELNTLNYEKEEEKEKGFIPMMVVIDNEKTFRVIVSVLNKDVALGGVHLIAKKNYIAFSCPRITDRPGGKRIKKVNLP